RDHENRHVQVANRGVLEEVEAAHSRQAHVQEDRVGPLGAERVERGLRVVRDDRFVADLLEELSEDLADRLIVVDDQYAHRVCPAGGYPLSSNRRTTGKGAVRVRKYSYFRSRPNANWMIRRQGWSSWPAPPELHQGRRALRNASGVARAAARSCSTRRGSLPTRSRCR